MPDQFIEIERKFLLSAFPEGLPLKRELQVYQAYLSIEPEVRIRRAAADGRDMAFYLTIKSGGGLARREVELDISARHFYALADMVPYPFIHKEFRVYQLPGGLELECSLVDPGLPSQFLYAEVEFPSEEDAERFVPPFGHLEEVTLRGGYRMRDYWERTRIHGGP